MAVVKIAGKQFVLNDGKRITTPFVDLEVGKILETKDMLTGDSISLEVLEQKRSKKILVVKFRNKSRYLRVIGQRNKITIMQEAIKKPQKVDKVEDKTEVKEVKAVKKTEAKKPVAKKTTVKKPLVKKEKVTAEKKVKKEGK